MNDARMTDPDHNTALMLIASADEIASACTTYIGAANRLAELAGDESTANRLDAANDRLRAARDLARSAAHSIDENRATMPTHVQIDHWTAMLHAAAAACSMEADLIEHFETIA